MLLLLLSDSSLKIRDHSENFWYSSARFGVVTLVGNSSHLPASYHPIVTIMNIAYIVAASAPIPQDGEVAYKDWVFINYTFKRFEGLTQRGTPTKKWTPPTYTAFSLNCPAT